MHLTQTASPAPSDNGDYFARRQDNLAALNASLHEEADSFFSDGKSDADMASELLAGIPGPSRDKFTFAELLTAYPKLNPPIVDGLFREGETVNVIANSKAGKSWLTYSLALSVITGQDWLGRFKTTPGKVLLIDNELHKATLAHRIPVVADAMGIPREHYERDLDVWPLRGHLRGLIDLESDFDDIEPGAYQIIAMDAKYRFAIDGKSENDNAAEANFYNRIDSIAERTKASILLIHHGSKGDQSEKRVTDVGAGAGAQSRAADCHLILREHEEPEIVVLEAAVRSFQPVEPLALRWNFPLWVPANDIDPAKLKGKRATNELRQDDKDREGISKIVDALRKWNRGEMGPPTPNKLEEQTGMSRGRQQRLLNFLVFEGQLTSTEITLRGNKTREYAFAE